MFEPDGDSILFISFVPIDDNITETQERVSFEMFSDMPLVEADNFNTFIIDDDGKKYKIFLLSGFVVAAWADNLYDTNPN